MAFGKFGSRFSGERKGEVIQAWQRFGEGRRNERRYPGMPRQLQSELREQNEGNEQDYFEALLRQRGEKFDANGNIIRLEVVSPAVEGEPGVQSEKDEDREPPPTGGKPYQPPTPPSVA